MKVVGVLQGVANNFLFSFVVLQTFLVVYTFSFCLVIS